MLVVNKLGYDAKCFISISVQDYFLQNLTYKLKDSESLVSIKAFDITDKLVQSPKFQRMIYKKPI